MTITSVLKEGGSLVIVEDGVTKKRSVVYDDAVCSLPPDGYTQVGVIYVDAVNEKLIVQYDGSSAEVELGAGGDLTGGEIVALLEALSPGSRLSHSKLDDVGASDHHSRYTDAEAKAASVQAGAITDGVTKAPTHDAVHVVEATAVWAAAAAAELAGVMATHEATSNAHHDKYTDAEAVAAAKTVKIDDLATPDDVTDLDFSTSLHGLVPKGTNVGHFLKDDGSWAAPTIGGCTQGARVYRSTNQDVANETSVKVNFDSERYDTDSIHSTVSNNSRLTCKTAGKYMIVFHGYMTANANGDRRFQIYLNNGTYIAVSRLGLDPSGYASMPVSTIYDLAVDDYVEAVVYQNSGSTLQLVSYGNFTPEFMMQRIG